MLRPDHGRGGAVLPDAGDADGPDLPVTGEPGDPTPPTAVLERLGSAFLRADLVVRRPGDTDPPAFAVLSGPGGCWTIAGGPPPSVARPVTADEARRVVEDAVGQVRAEAVALDRR